MLTSSGSKYYFQRHMLSVLSQYHSASHAVSAEPIPLCITCCQCRPNTTLLHMLQCRANTTLHQKLSVQPLPLCVTSCQCSQYHSASQAVSAANTTLRHKLSVQPIPLFVTSCQCSQYHKFPENYSVLHTVSITFNNLVIVVKFRPRCVNPYQKEANILPKFLGNFANIFPY